MSDQNLYTMLPLLAMIFKDNMIITLIPLAYFIGKWLLKKYRELPDLGCTVDVYEKNYNIKHTLTPFSYLYISYYISHILKDKVHKYEIYNYRMLENAIVDDWELGNNLSIQFEFEKQPIIINKWIRYIKNKPYHVLTIRASSKSHICRFINECQKIYRKFEKRVNYNNECMEFDEINKVWITVNINVHKTYENIYLKSSLKKKLINEIKTFKNSKKLYKKRGIPYKKGLLFYGVPGCGKSSTVYAIARENKMVIYKINANRFTSANDLSIAIRRIEKNSIILIEDIDTCKFSSSRLNKKDKNKKDNLSKVTLGDYLEILDGYTSLKGCIIIFTTNFKEKLDDALIRPGRMDSHYKFSYVSQEIVNQIFKDFYEKDAPFIDYKITSSELINSIVLPNDYKTALKLIDQKSKANSLKDGMSKANRESKTNRESKANQSVKRRAESELQEQLQKIKLKTC